MKAVDLAQPRYAHLAKASFAETDLRKHLLEHHAQHGRLPTVRALRETFGGGYSRLVRIRQGVEVELGLRDAARSSRRTLGRLETVTTRLTDLGKTRAADAPLEALAQKVEALQVRLEQREAQLGKALAALQAHVERLEPAWGRRFRGLQESIAERRADDATATATAPVEPRLLKQAAERLDQVVVRAERGLETRAATDPPPAWVRAAAASATAALDGRLQSIEETLRDHAAIAQNEMRAVSEATRRVVADGATQLAAAKATLSDVAQRQRQEVEVLRPLHASVESLIGHARHRATIADQRAGAVSEALYWIAESQLAQVEVFEAGMVARETQSTKRSRASPPPFRRRRS